MTITSSSPLKRLANHWSVFYKAFVNRDKKNSKTSFHVQVQVPAGEQTESFWFDVQSIDGNIVKGHFDCDGLIATSVHKGQQTTVESKEISDWSIDDGKANTG